MIAYRSDKAVPQEQRADRLTRRRLRSTDVEGDGDAVMPCVDIELLTKAQRVVGG